MWASKPRVCRLTFASLVFGQPGLIEVPVIIKGHHRRWVGPKANDQRPIWSRLHDLAIPPAISRLGQIAINAHDVDRATAFYRDILGLPLLFTAGSLAFFDCGGVRLMLTHPEKPEFDHPSSVLYFAVPDIAAAHRQMLEPAACTSKTSPI